MDKRKERAEMRRRNREAMYREMDRAEKTPLTVEEQIRFDCLKAQIRQKLKEEGLL